MLRPGGSGFLKCLLRPKERAEVGANPEHFGVLCIFLWESRRLGHKDSGSQRVSSVLCPGILSRDNLPL